LPCTAVARQQHRGLVLREQCVTGWWTASASQQARAARRAAVTDGSSSALAVACQIGCSDRRRLRQAAGARTSASAMSTSASHCRIRCVCIFCACQNPDRASGKLPARLPRARHCVSTETARTGHRTRALRAGAAFHRKRDIFVPLGGLTSATVAMRKSSGTGVPPFTKSSPLCQRRGMLRGSVGSRPAGEPAQRWEVGGASWQQHPDCLRRACLAEGRGAPTDGAASGTRIAGPVL